MSDKGKFVKLFDTILQKVAIFGKKMIIDERKTVSL